MDELYNIGNAGYRNGTMDELYNIGNAGKRNSETSNDKKVIVRN